MAIRIYLFSLFLALTAYAQQQERVAIIQTVDDGDSIKPSDLAYLTDKLRETAVNVLPKQQYGVMTTESIVAFLGSQERAIKECKESSCLAELGRKVNADYVAQGRIGRFGKELTIKVELYNSKSGNLIGSFTGDSKNIYGLRDIINEKAPDLFKKMPTAPPPSVVATQPPQQEPQQVQYQPQPSANMEQRAKIQRLIDKGLAENKEEIQREASSLSHIDKAALYDENKKSALGYALLNFFPGFGLGSYVQGDNTSGVTQTIMDVAGWGLIFGGIAMTDDVSGIVVSGCVILIAGRFTAWVFPSIHQNKYNEALDEALNSNNNVSYSIDPLIVPKDGTPAIGLVFNLRY